MIPKVIHYCWFGRNPLPKLAIRCIESWKKHLPDYKIIEWNEDNFNVNIIPYTAEAYRAKKFAFVSDYARFWILHKYGGLYFDTDVEIIRPINDIITKGPFMGFEQPSEEVKQTSSALYDVAPGLALGATPGLAIYKELLDHYQNLHFLGNDGKPIPVTIVKHTTDVLKTKGLIPNNTLQKIAGVWIYPWDVFCPQSYWTKKYNASSNTVSIHHYSDSWNSARAKFLDHVFKRHPWIKPIYFKIRKFI